MNKKIKANMHKKSVVVVPGVLSTNACCSNCRHSDYDSERGEYWCGIHGGWSKPWQSCGDHKD